MKGKGQRSTSGPRAGLDEGRAEKQGEVRRVNFEGEREISQGVFSSQDKQIQ